MEIDGKEFLEKYKRPCLALCTKCGMHGVIIFEDGSYSDNIRSLSRGEELIKKLVAQEILDKEDAKRISDQLVCSDLPLNESVIDGKETPLVAVAVVSIIRHAESILQELEKEADSNSDSQSFAC